jgi:hypothetical protein
MADNFDYVKYIQTHKIGPYGKLNESPEEGRAEEIARRLKDDYGMDEEGIQVYLEDDMGLSSVVADAIIDRLFAGDSDDRGADDDDDMYNDLRADDQRINQLDESTTFGRTISNLGMLEEILDNLLRNTATNSNIPTDDKQGLLDAFNEMKELVLQIGSDVEQEEEGGEDMTDYMQRRKQGGY